MSLKAPERGYFAAISMLVDINGFTALVANNKLDIGIGIFVRNVFSGAIMAIEQNRLLSDRLAVRSSSATLVRDQPERPLGDDGRVAQAATVHVRQEQSSNTRGRQAAFSL